MNCNILTTEEAAQYVRLGKPTLERLRLTGNGPRYAKLGGSVRYRRSDLDEWLEGRLTNSTSAASKKVANGSNGYLVKGVGREQ